MTEPRRYPTSLAGRLEDIELPELIQFLAGNRKTGRLTLTRRDGHGVLLRSVRGLGYRLELAEAPPVAAGDAA